YKHCDCPKWYTGTYEGKWHPRTSLKTTSWDQAEKELALIRGERPPKPEPGTSLFIAPQQVVDAWLEEAAVNQIAEGTMGQWKLMGSRLVEFCARQKIRSFDEIDAAAINKWRAEWQQEENPRRAEPGICFSTARVRLSILKLLFKFARRMRWITEN